MAHIYGSNVPEAREDIQIIVNDLRAQGDHAMADRLEAVLHKMHRRPPVRETRKKIPAPTKSQKDQVRFLARTTDMSQLEIAVAVGLNPGRVSEILNGN